MIGIGDNVVCIDYRGRHGENGERVPKLGMVYTVRGFYYDKAVDCRAIHLEEIINKPLNYQDGFLEASWPIKYFRKVKKTSIKIFQEMCVKPKEPVCV